MFPNKFYKISCDSVHVFKIVMIYIYTLSWRMVESSLPVPEDNVTMFLLNSLQVTNNPNQ